MEVIAWRMVYSIVIVATGIEKVLRESNWYMELNPYVQSARRN
jgi:hypothetical protein